jgi:hypothetical protein
VAGTECNHNRKDATRPKRSESAAFQRNSDKGVAVTLKHLSTSGE